MRPDDAWPFVPPVASVVAGHASRIQPKEQIEPIEHGIWRTIRDFSLVLSSQNIHHTVSQNELGPWEIHVKEEDIHAAQTQIALYKQENPNWDIEAAALPMLMPSTQPLWFLLIPVACTLFQFQNPHISAFGMADAARILKGEWFRLFTAQTLHSSNHHLVSNLIAGFLVFSFISFKMPLARIAPFIVLAAALANFLTALFMKNYHALGFSSTVFAAMGALATIEVRILTRENFKHRIAPWFAVVLLGVYLGVGNNETSNVDIPGHIFGLAMGIIAGYAPPKKWLRWGEPVLKLDVFLVLGIYAFFALAWVFALTV